MRGKSPYGMPPRWGREYDKYCPDHTDGASRHVKMISESFRRGPIEKLLREAGFEPDHWASSMEVTVLALWRTRKELAALKAKVAK